MTIIQQQEGLTEDKNTSENQEEKTKNKIQWHPAFCAATELEFRDNKGDLVFIPEVLLSKKPLQIDLLILKKNKETTIYNEIGSLFKETNILEYKGLKDSLSIDDFYKTIAYACLYKALQAHTNAVPADTISILIIRDSYPRDLMKELIRLGNSIENPHPGIFHVTGNMLFTVQIVVTIQLSPKGHSAYRSLTQDAKREDIEAFLRNAETYTEKDDRDNVDAVLQVIATANSDLFRKIREDINMCEALRRLMADEIDKEIDEAVRKVREEADAALRKSREEADAALRKSREEADATVRKTREEADAAIQKARTDGFFDALRTLVNDHFLSLKDAASQAGMSVDEFNNKMIAAAQSDDCK